jgi:hypothetical protein
MQRGENGEEGEGREIQNGGGKSMLDASRRHIHRKNEVDAIYPYLLSLSVN